MTRHQPRLAAPELFETIRLVELNTGEGGLDLDGRRAMRAGVILGQPQPTVAQSRQNVSDSALFEDVFQQVEQTQPDSLAPVQALFEERQ